MITWLALSTLFIVPLWRIFRRVGLKPGYTLFWVLPLLGPLIVLMILAFGAWRIVPQPAPEASVMTEPLP